MVGVLVGILLYGFVREDSAPGNKPVFDQIVDFLFGSEAVQENTLSKEGEKDFLDRLRDGWEWFKTH